MRSIWKGELPPPKGSQPCYDIVAPKLGEVWEMTFLDECMLGLRTHWAISKDWPRGRTIRCFAEEGDCPNCKRWVETWTAFIGIYRHGLNKCQILRLGPPGARRLAAFALPIGGLRGVRLSATVQNDGKGKAFVFSKSQHDPMSPLAQAHDITRSVAMALGCSLVPDYRYSADELREEGGAA